MYRDFHIDKSNFQVYKDWEFIVNSLESDKEVADLFRALFAFASRGEIPEFTGALKLAFQIMANQIQKDGEKWVDVCNRNIENAKKGGRPKQATALNAVHRLTENRPLPTATDRNRPLPTATDRKRSQPKKPDKERDKDKDKDKDKEMDKDKDLDFDLERERDKETETEKIIHFAPEPTPSDETKQRFGEYKHVLLTEKQYNKLIEDFGKEKTAEYIRRSDEYTQQHGKIYSDYNLTIRKWIYEDAKAEKEKSSTAESAAYRSSLPLPIEKLERLLSAPYTGDDVSDLQAEFDLACGC